MTLVDEFRKEIVENFKISADFMKWKLLIVGVVASIGFGIPTQISSTPVPVSPYVLATIPFLCIYVDLMVYNCIMRAVVIGIFFANAANEAQGEVRLLIDYEYHRRTLDRDRTVFWFDWRAALISSVVSNGFVLLFSLWILCVRSSPPLPDESIMWIFIAISTLLGSLISVFLGLKYREKLKELHNMLKTAHLARVDKQA